MRIVFMGSPDFSLPTLVALSQAHAVVGVVTRPDQQAGRGRALRSPQVKLLADELHLPTIQPPLANSPDTLIQLSAWNPDLIVVVAYGQILRQPLLQLPPHGCLNVHASLLPRWRGAAPVQAAILAGDLHTGVTIMVMDQGLDTGPILAQTSTPIEPDETSGQLASRLSQLGAQLLLQTLDPFVQGHLSPTPQNAQEATYAPLLRKSDGQLDWTQPAATLARQVRAFHPWPGSYFTWRGRRITVHAAHPIPAPFQQPGTPTLVAKFPAVSTTDGLLVLDILQPPGGRPMPGDAFLRGAPQLIGATLSTS